MTVVVEFYGLARHRAGRPGCGLDLCAASPTLRDALQAIAQALPTFAADCLDGDRLRPEFIANLGGERFVSDPDTPLPPNVPLLILSADAGG